MRIVTLYPECTNTEMVKDAGQIAYTLNKREDVTVTIASKYIAKDENNQDYLSQIELIRLPKLNNFISGMLFVLKYAKQYDWMFFYHGGRRCYYWTKMYKLLNPKGKVYIKMDLGFEMCRRYREEKKERDIFLKTTKAADIVSVECKKIQKIIEEITGIELLVIPNGYIYVDEEKISKVKREDCFITVGRLGTPPKATDILLEAFALSAKKHNWNLKLVGPIDESFKLYLDVFLNDHPELKERIKITGPKYVREELYAEYRSAKVFVLPSRWEAFPLVGPEALSNGCRMILSDMIPPIDELMHNGEYGTVIKAGDVESLSVALKHEASRDYSDQESIEIKDYARDNFLWDSICNKLYGYMIS